MATSADWKESYRLGIRGVDDDHFILVSLVMELQDAVYSGRGRETTQRILGNLASYVAVRFSREERLMQSHHYPDLEKHRALHDRFARNVLQFHDSYRQGNTDLSDEVLRFLKDWILGHIQSVDREAAAFLLERGVR